MLRVMNRGGWLYVSGMIDGQRVMRSLKMREGREREAELVRIEMEKAMLTATPKVERSATFGELGEAYLRWRQMEGRVSIGDWHAVKVATQAWGKTEVRKITSTMGMDLVRENWSDLKPGTVRRYLKVVRAVFNFGTKNKLCSEVPTVPLPKVDDARDLHLNIEEIRAYLEFVRTSRPAVYAAMCVLVDCGLRLGELMELRFRDVRDGYVHVRKKDHGKSKGRSVPMSKRCAHAIEAIRGADGGAYVYNDGGEAFASKNRARNLLDEALAAGCASIGVEKLRIHDLRHTFAYQAAQHGADLGDLQQLMGHKTLAMTLRYRGFIKSRAASVVQNFGYVQKLCCTKPHTLGWKAAA